MKGQSPLMSHSNNSWGTPDYLYDKLNAEFVFTLDPCATDDNHKCNTYFTEEINGLSKSWAGYTAFVNPPYNQSKEWINKCYNEWKDHGVTVVMLIPARTDTRAFYDVIVPNAAQIRFLKGRVKFVGATSGAPFPSAIIVFSNVKYSEKVIWVDYGTK